VAKSPNPTDIHVGSRVRMRRLMLDLRQTDLANAIGITFQFFFEGLSGPTKAGKQAGAPTPTHVNEFIASSDGLSLIKAYRQIKSRPFAAPLSTSSKTSPTRSSYPNLYPSRTNKKRVTMRLPGTVALPIRKGNCRFLISESMQSHSNGSQHLNSPTTAAPVWPRTTESSASTVETFNAEIQEIYGIVNDPA
jgi:hypothetical protein